MVVAPLDDPRTFIRQCRRVLRVALQPIVDVRSGEIRGVEALCRGWQDLGFSSPDGLFDHAFRIGALTELEMLQAGRAIDLFGQAGLPDRTMLFLNLDGRLLTEIDRTCRTLTAHARAAGVLPSSLCIELSEGHQPLPGGEFAAAVRNVRSPGFRIAIDDFGTGVAGLQMLYQTNPNLVKIDRYFIQSLPDDPKKRLLVSAIVTLVHTLGGQVIAEGVETEEEFIACRDAGADLIQGFFIGRPMLAVEDIRPRAAVPAGSDRAGTVGQRVSALVEEVPTLRQGAGFAALRALYEEARIAPVVPVVDGNGALHGAIREADVRPILMSRFGPSLSRNRTASIVLEQFIRPVPTLDISGVSSEGIALIADRADDGVILTEGSYYRGYLSPKSLLTLLNEERLDEAAARNPLSGLPGNRAIAATSDRLRMRPEDEQLIALVDINGFKPFNDRYGFSTGDQAILILADLITRIGEQDDVFAGHIGGDDFVVIAEAAACQRTLLRLRTLPDAFREAAMPLHPEADRIAEGFVGESRQGQQERFPLLGCTVACLTIPAGLCAGDNARLSRRLSAIKMRAREQKKSLLTELYSDFEAPVVDLRAHAAGDVLKRA